MSNATMKTTYQVTATQSLFTSQGEVKFVWTGEKWDSSEMRDIDPISSLEEAKRIATAEQENFDHHTVLQVIAWSEDEGEMSSEVVFELCGNQGVEGEE